MKRQIFSYLGVSVIALLTVFTLSCKKNNDNIEVKNSETLNQTILADQTSGSNVTFVTTGAWSSTIKETTSIPTKGGTWISIEPDHGNAAGTYTVAINLEPNETGADRSVVITITCGDMNVDIKVTQKTTTSIRLVSRFIGEITADFTYDAQNRLSLVDFGNNYTVPITYPSANTMLAIFEGNEWVFNLNNDGYVTSISSPSIGYYEDGFEYENGYLTSGCIWEDGNLKQCFSTTYSYSTTPYKEINIAPWMVPMWSIGGFEAFYSYFPNSFFGKSSKNLMTQQNRNGERTNYRYELDANGYVTKGYFQRLDDPYNPGEYTWFEVLYK